MAKRENTDSEQQQSVVSRATASVRDEREVLRELLEETRAIYSKQSAEYRELLEKLSQLGIRLDGMLASPSDVSCPQELAVEVTSVRDLDSILRQRLDWLGEKLLETQTAARKLRTVVQQFDDTIGYLTSSVGSDPDDDVNGIRLSRVRLLQAQEDERQRLAREIHDSPAQALANAIFELEYCERLAEKNPQQMRMEIARLKGDLREALADVRHFISDLRPAPLLELGLSPVLRRYVDDYQTRFGIKVNFKLHGMDRLPSANELAIYRIVQEALQNTRKHSGASEVCITSRQDSESIEIKIEDNGCGFDVEHFRDREGQHFGLTSMADRARLIGAELQISSGDGGTTIILTVPKVGEANDV